MFPSLAPPGGVRAAGPWWVGPKVDDWPICHGLPVSCGDRAATSLDQGTRPWPAAVASRRAGGLRAVDVPGPRSEGWAGRVSSIRMATCCRLRRRSNGSYADIDPAPTHQDHVTCNGAG